jgi:nuclear pore complex protein Nup155
VPIEYCGEDQAICAVGIARPKPGVFLEAIHHLVVLCTTSEVRIGRVVSRGGAEAK